MNVFCDEKNCEFCIDWKNSLSSLQSQIWCIYDFDKIRLKIDEYTWFAKLKKKFFKFNIVLLILLLILNMSRIAKCYQISILIDVFFKYIKSLCNQTWLKWLFHRDFVNLCIVKLNIIRIEHFFVIKNFKITHLKILHSRSWMQKSAWFLNSKFWNLLNDWLFACSTFFLHLKWI